MCTIGGLGRYVDPYIDRLSVAYRPIYLYRSIVGRLSLSVYILIVIVNPPRAEQPNMFEATAKLPTGILKDYGLGINSAIFPKNYIYPLTL